ncbi:MAG: hypothetical protein ACJ77K_01040 [Bacteroidia bacterium]
MKRSDLSLMRLLHPLALLRNDAAGENEAIEAYQALSSKFITVIASETERSLPDEIASSAGAPSQ